MELHLDLDYWDDAVGCFDPERVTARVWAAFPEAAFDPADHAEREVEAVEASLAASDASDETKASVRRQIRGKARRNGPVYRFRLPLPSGATVEGGAGRYTVWLRSAEPLPADEQARLHDFLASLRLGDAKPEVRGGDGGETGAAGDRRGKGIGA